MAVDTITFVAPTSQEIELALAGAGSRGEVFHLGDWVLTVTYSEAIDLPEALSLEAYMAELDAAADRLAGRVAQFQSLDALFADLDGEG